jgi:hypothetical protein
MGTSSSKIGIRKENTIRINRRRENTYIRNGLPPIKEGNGIEADGRSVYSDKPSRRTYNIPSRRNFDDL